MKYKWMHSFLKVLFVLEILSASLAYAESPMFQHYDQYVKDKWAEQIGPSPFGSSCQAIETRQNKPITDLTRWSIPTQDNVGVSARDFLKKLALHVSLKANSDYLLISSVRACMIPVPRTDTCECATVMTFFQGKEAMPKNLHCEAPARKKKDDAEDLSMQDYIAEARYNAAMSNMRYDFPKMDYSLKVSSVYKYLPWQPLTDSEKAVALKSANDYSQEVENAWKTLSPAEKQKTTPGKFVRKQFQLLKDLHLKKYKLMMAQYPFLTFVTSPAPLFGEFISAIKQVEGASKKEILKLNQIKQNLSDPKKALTSFELELLNYNSFAEGILLQEEKYCSIAAGLSGYKDAMAVRSDLALLAPVLITSFLAPPVIATSVGSLLNLAYVFQSQNELESLKVKKFSTFMSSNPEQDDFNDELVASKGNVKFQIVSGLAFTALPIASPGAKKLIGILR